MNELVVGTAGHVDHGKTTLVRALTGVDCDRLVEERRRSMTIEVGFAPWLLPSGREVSVVDVPGHERFIRTMAIGARSVDLALLCVAADDGVMPQTREHAAVLRLLGVGRVLPVVTKADLAPERVRACSEQALDLLREIGLERGRSVACSAATGAGLEELGRVVDAELTLLPKPLDRGVPRLLVDRSFSKVGTGTVVTGHLDGGSLVVGQQIEVFPTNGRGRVLGLQRRSQNVEVAEPGGRLAAALHGLGVQQVGRGCVVGLPGDPWGTQSVDCAISVPPDGARGVRQGMHLEVLAGTATAQARIWLAGEAELGPGHSGFGQLHLEEPLWTLPGDLLVLRAPSPEAILGGALVLDSHPKRHRRWSMSPLESWGLRERSLTVLSVPGLQQLALFEAQASPFGLGASSAGGRSGLAPVQAAAALEQAAVAGELTRLGSLYLSPQRWGAIVDHAIATLEEHQRQHPLNPGMPRGQLARVLGFRVEGQGEAALRRLRDEGVLQLQGPVASLPGQSPIGIRSAAAERISAILSRTGFTPPGVPELRQAGLTDEIRSHLLRGGDVVSLGPGILIAKVALQEMESRLEAILAAAADGLTVAQIRDHLGSSRRIVVPLLERWERERRAERTGDKHRLRSEECRAQ
ncbi:MAG: selenocysteine-specific translation elongation factor [Candidatus Dormibacteria bacterium]